MMQKVNIKKNVFSENDRIAERLKQIYASNNLLVLNIIGSPGCGKTTLLEKTLEALKDKLNIYILVGDVQTEEDAKRLRESGGDAKQIITGGACHLDARMVERELENLDLDQLDILIIENVGNLVCPASYDLGEDIKVVMLSVPEGEEKPLKYPTIFHKSDVFILSKIDYLQLGGFDADLAEQNALKINPRLQYIRLSSKTGEGFDNWLEIVEKALLQKQA